jgi:N-acetylmuramic acid 6-phosphate etherase
MKLTVQTQMVDVKSTNLKLQQRARNIIREVCGPTCPASDTTLDGILLESRGSVKLAIVMVHLGLTIDAARQRLEGANGILADVLRRSCPPADANGVMAAKPHPVLCIDGGGSKCAAYVLTDEGESGMAVGPPCNV